ncbi:hypothetical protein, partial [Klebsiella pneumoniae]|uniref:hypothetical protein n=1 Tax=Klebsiella pneumoniae TaxID=573 RepID=UPI0025A2556D
EDSSEARLTFARENSSLTSVIDTGTILWAGDKGRWTLETINDDNPFRIAVGNNLVTPENTYLATFYSEFPYALTDDMKAYT